MRHLIAAPVAILAMAALTGCAERGAPGSESTHALKVTAEQFRGLSWLEGDWRGEMPDGKPFFERYRLADDSTLVSYTLADSSATTPSDSGAIMLRGDSIITGSDGHLWTVTQLAPGRVSFDPRRGATNSFIWERTGPDAWTATLIWPATPERPAREVVYRMTRRP